MATNNQAIPKVQTTDRNINQLQQNILTVLGKILSNPILSNNFLFDVPLAVGPTTINHLLERELIGWIIVRQRAASNIYDMQDTNQSPETTLILNSSSTAVVDILVF